MSEGVEAVLTIGPHSEKGKTNIIISVEGNAIWTGHITEELTNEELYIKGTLSFPNHLVKGGYAYDVQISVSPTEGLYLRKEFGSGAGKQLGTFKSKEVQGIKHGNYGGKGQYAAA